MLLQSRFVLHNRIPRTSKASVASNEEEVEVYTQSGGYAIYCLSLVAKLMQFLAHTRSVNDDDETYKIDYHF